MRRFPILLSLVLSLTFCVPSARGHKLKLFATLEGQHVTGYAYVAGEGPLRDMTVRVTQERGGGLITNVVTDSEGRFSYRVTVPGRHRLEMDVGDGHRAEWQVATGDNAATNPAPAAPVVPAASSAAHPDDPAQWRAVQQQIRNLAIQLEAHDARRRWSDVAGGIGYLVGLSGLAFYVLGIRRQRQRESSS